MAGGKETPRQKMIGMMYLVLTALLALNVSSAVLEKFIFINGTLEELVQENIQQNANTITGIQSTVQEKGNRPADVKALDKAKEVRKLTTELLSNMENLKKQMIQITGGTDPKTGKLMGSQDYDKVANMMLQSPTGKEFEKELDQYVAKLNEIAGTNFPQLTKDAQDIQIFKDDPNQKTKDFLQITFEATPTAAGLASVTQLQAEALELENSALQKIAEQVGAKDVEFDRIVPMVRPEARIVAAGAPYEADMFITASASGITPTFAVNGDKIESVVDEATGITMGKVKFTAKPGDYDRETGLARQTFQAAITLNDSTYTETIEYFVVRPTVQIRSAALQALYQNCGNELDIQVPALGTNYNPSFSSPDAKIVKGNKPGLVTVIPEGRAKVKLTISNSGNVISTETFDVKKIPPPRIELTARRRPVDPETGVNINDFAALDLEVRPDENFAREVPKDAQYRIMGGEARLISGGNIITRMKLTGGRVDLSSWRSRASKGMSIQLKVERVVRRTYSGGTDNVETVINNVIMVPVN